MVISLEISLRYKLCPVWSFNQPQRTTRWRWRRGASRCPPPSPPSLPGSSRILLKDPEDIKRLWKPDVFVDQATTNIYINICPKSAAQNTRRALAAAPRWRRRRLPVVGAEAEGGGGVGGLALPGQDRIGEQSG